MCWEARLIVKRLVTFSPDRAPIHPPGRKCYLVSCSSGIMSTAAVASLELISRW